MGWKYIMFETKIDTVTVLFPVIFPDKLVHSEVAGRIKTILPAWRAGGTVKIASAGKIEHIEPTGVGGDSETLGTSSDPEDEGIINNYSYFHGIK